MHRRRRYASRHSSSHTGLREKYFIPRLTRTEYATLKWLSDHGYDGSILETLGVDEEHDDGGATLGGATEPQAWEIKEYVDSDADAFLSSNASRSLAEKLWHFIDSIV